MHFDSSFRAIALLALFGSLASSMLVPPQIMEAEQAALEQYSALTESLHAESGAIYDTFKQQHAAGLAFQDSLGSKGIITDDHQVDGNAQDNDFNAQEYDTEVLNKHKNKHNGEHGFPSLVPVVLGVMSKCPDAELCESVFDKTLAQVSDIVDLHMVYIGHLNESMSPYGVQCMHGPHECDGNVQQLCVRDSSLTSQRDWWNFIQCQNFQDLSRVGDYSVAKQCAKAIGRNWEDDFEDCYTGKRGAKLLQKSVKEAEKLKIQKSCTILINGKLAGIHDGTWKNVTAGHDAGDFQHLIEKEYKTINGLA